MNTPDTVHARRDAILTAANEEMRRARAQRMRSARITSIAAVILLSAITAATLPRTSSSNESRLEGTRALAIDFQSVATQAPTIDFAIVRSMDHQTTRTLSLEIVTDEEAEQGLHQPDNINEALLLCNIKGSLALLVGIVSHCTPGD